MQPKGSSVTSIPTLRLPVTCVPLQALRCWFYRRYLERFSAPAPLVANHESCGRPVQALSCGAYVGPFSCAALDLETHPPAFISPASSQ